MGTLEQKKQLQSRSNYLILIAIASGIGGIMIQNVFGVNGLTDVVGPMMFLTGVVTWFIGLCSYAKSKGYSAITGLIGFIGLIGLIILLVLPDKWKSPAPPVIDPNSNYPRDPNRM